jgi:hypothetical protein
MIVPGEINEVDGISEFEHHFNVDLVEFVEALPVETREKILGLENETRAIEGMDPIDHPVKAPDPLILDAIREADSSSLIQEVLEQRNRRYILRVNDDVHTIIEVYDPM